MEDGGVDEFFFSDFEDFVDDVSEEGEVVGLFVWSFLRF